MGDASEGTSGADGARRDKPQALGRGSEWLRLGSIYGAIFLAGGVLMPFWPVWLEWRGLDAVEIGIVLAAPIWAKVIANPFIAQVADRRGERKRLMTLMAAAALAAGLALFAVRGFAAIAALALIMGLCFSSIVPLAENVTMLRVYARDFDYGRIRLWGSVSFIVAAWGTGVVLEGRTPALVLWLILAGFALCTVAAWRLPDVRPEAADRSRAPLRALLAEPAMLWFVAAAGLVQSSHMVYYGFATLHWRAQGLSDVVIGGLWAEGVIVEVALFAVSGAVTRRFRPDRMLVFAAVIGLLRWTATGLTSALAALVLVQSLHAVTFGLTHLAAMHFIARAVPTAYSATAQSLYSGISMGAFAGLMMLIAGPLYASFGGSAFLAMGLVSLAGAGAALVLARRWSGGTLVMP